MHTSKHTHLLQSLVFFLELQDVVNLLLLILVAQQLGIITTERLHLFFGVLTLAQQQLLLTLVGFQLLLPTTKLQAASTWTALVDDLVPCTHTHSVLSFTGPFSTLTTRYAMS